MICQIFSLLLVWQEHPLILSTLGQPSVVLQSNAIIA